MEKAIVTFLNPETNKQIEINLVYNKETSDLDYDVKFSDETAAKEQMDFTGFLADMFLKSLQIE